MKDKKAFGVVVFGLLLVFFSGCQSREDVPVSLTMPKGEVATQTQVQKITSNSKIEDCKSIEDRAFRNFCEGFILAGKAKSNSDVDVCNNASSAEVKELCIGYVKEKK
ncbi:MAG TPA: hypothetical protein P5229_04175 [Candidatus Gracilibacteria bacterium]|nr:hypothetical protein [Candidatus Gracilibacteria bacterium]